MRAILMILILAVIALVGLFASGLLHLQQTRPAQIPSVSTNGASLTAKGGQTPAFDVETGKVVLGSRPVTVNVNAPSVSVERPGAPANAAAPATRNTQ